VQEEKTVRARKSGPDHHNLLPAAILQD
jgi:hypothetical protein